MSFRQRGFTLVELVAVIVLLGILAATVLPRFIGLQSSARTAVLDNIRGTMLSTITMVQLKARVQGLSVAAGNPGNQSAYIIDFGGQTSEVDWRNLCPESSAELGDAMDMKDFISLNQSESGGLLVCQNNQYTWVGYDLGDSCGSSPPSSDGSAAGCYIVYDSFGDPDCKTIENNYERC